MKKFFYSLSLLVVLLSSTSKLLSQTYKFDFNLDYIAGITSNVYMGDLTAVNDSIALVAFGSAIICKVNFKTGKTLDTLENKVVYEKIKEALNSTEIYKDAEFYDVINKDDIKTCNHYYFQFRRIIRVDTATYVSEVTVNSINPGVLLHVLIYFNRNLEITKTKVLESTYSSYGVSYMSLIGYFEKNNEIFIHSSLSDTSVYDKYTPCFFSRFRETGDYYKFSGFIDGVTHGQRRLYTARFFTSFTNHDTLCISNGWEVFYLSDDVKRSAKKRDLGLPANQVYATIRQIGKNRYLAVKMNLAYDGAAINDCKIVLLDENFKEYETVIQFYIQRFSLNSIDYLDGIAYLFIHDLPKAELLLIPVKIDDDK